MYERIIIDRKNHKVYTEFHPDSSNPTEVTERSELTALPNG